MKNDNLLVDGALGVFAGTMAWSLLGPGIIPAVMTAAGAGAILYRSIRPKDQDWEILCDNLGLCVDGPEQTKMYPKLLKRIKTDTGEKLWLTLPYGLTTLDFEKVRYRMEQYFDAEISIEYKDKKAILEIHTKKLPELVEFGPQKIGPNEWIVGRKNGEGMETIKFDDNNAHMFVAGMTGYGKTNFFNINLLNANLQHRPEDVEYWIIDLKGGSELVPFANAKLTRYFTGDLDEAVGLLNKLVIEVKRRLAEQLKRREEGKQKPRFKPVFCIIDEYPNILFRKEAFETLCYIARTARSVDVHLIIATQRSSHEYLPGILKCNLPATVCFATKSEADSEVALGRGNYDGVFLQHKGRAILDTPAKRITVQVPYVKEKELIEMLKPHRKVVKNDDNRERLPAFGALGEGSSNDGSSSIFDTLSSSKTKRKNRKAQTKGVMR